ncbi:hypothetical protein BGZ76_008670 [Entomortierella beljakovae]|nr:hypothetical protein BGZ76_008670 [Entomortierella beljakovae]
MPFSYKSAGSSSKPSNLTASSFATSNSAASSSSPYSSHQDEIKFKVVIIGAGIGGLMMGYCLERAGIDYVILERRPKPLIAKATIQLTANTLHVIEQLGLLGDIMRIGKPISHISLRKHNMSVVGKIDGLYVKERYGYYSYIVQRSEFCQLLMSKIPQNRLLWGRYVLETVNGDLGIQCRCANGHVVQGDVLVGADGAYSAVRQNLYKTLKEKNLLPKSDMESLKFTQNAIIGMTDPMNLSQYPEAGTSFGEVHIVVGKDSPYTMWISPTSEDRINWSVTGPLLTDNKGDQNFMVSQFGQEEVEKACDIIGPLECPYGGTMEGLLANTPKENITKILIEEKHYKTWYHGRTVLIGDACHKFVSFSGQGPEQAMLDAIALVNLFHGLKSPYPLEDIVESFQSYYEQRLPVAKAAVQSSGQVANLINGQGLGSDVKRKLVFNMPTWIQAMSVDKMQVRPLLNFLPAVQDRGSKSVRTPSIRSVAS